MASISGEDLIPTDSVSSTAAEAIADIHKTLRNLLGSSGFNIIPVPSSSNATKSSTVKDATLHSLSSVCLADAKKSLKSSLKTLRNAVAARESWDDESSQRFSRVKLDTIGRERAVSYTKSALSECKRLALTTDPFATKVMLAIHRLKAVAEQAGAMTTEDTTTNSNGTIDSDLTVCKKKFITDLIFSDIRGKQIQVEVKFRLLTSDDMEVPDSDISSSFKQYICDEDFDSLKQAFTNLVEMEKLSDTIPQISITDSLRNVEADFLAMQAAEQDLPDSEQQRMILGHGIINRTALGLQIKYMKDRTVLLGVEPASTPQSITLARSFPTVETNMTDSGFSDFQFKSLSKPNPVCAQYVLKFNEPVIMALPIAQSLARIGGSPVPAKSANPKQLGISSNTGREAVSLRSDSRNDDNSDGSQSWPSLQKLLAPLVFDANASKDSDTIAKSEEQPYTAKPVIKHHSHWSQDCVEFVSAVELPDNHYLEFSHSESESEIIPSVIIHRVLFCHPRQVKHIFGLVRQQIVFNELFKSCFEKPINVDSSLIPLQSQPVEVVICDAPSFMQFSLYNQTIEDMLSMGVTISIGGEIQVTLRTSEERYQGCTDAKATAILRVSRSIPLTIFTIAKMEASFDGRQA